MATDKSEPKIGMIVKIGVTAIVSLVVVRGALIAYFDHVTDAEFAEKVWSVKNPQLKELRAREQDDLTNAPMPIDKSKELLMQQGRMISQIHPHQSDDMGPMEGWKMMPHDAGVVQAAADAGHP